MAVPHRIGETQQQNLITLLVHSDESGKLISRLAPPELFEGEFHTIAERAIEYWREFDQAPKMHMIDLLADILEDPHNRRAITLRRILMAMEELSRDANPKYIISQLSTFRRLQELKSAIVTAAEVLNSPRETTIEDVEGLLHDILRARTFDFSGGTLLSDHDKLIASMTALASNEFDTGIKAFDDFGVVPARGMLDLLIAPSGRGKTWWLVHLGRRAMMRRKKVLHVTLELSEEQTLMRYYQGLFAVPKHKAKSVVLPSMEYGPKGEFSALTRNEVQPDFTLKSEVLREELIAHSAMFGTKLKNVIIKEFPQRSLTIAGLEAFLDQLEDHDGFIPDMLIIDYPQIMDVDVRNMRLSIGDNVARLRGIAQARNMAVVGAHQGSRASADARNVTATHAGEDWSIVQTADIIRTYSATIKERQIGLARVFIDKARSDKDKFGVLITQSYATGQFVLESAFMPAAYYDYLDAQVGVESEGGTDDDDDESED